jgi:pyruvate dehydrogenase E1 component alpha subunit
MKQPTDEMIQLLTPDGLRVRHPEYDSLIADIGLTELGALYRDLAVVRCIDQEATLLQRKGELALWAPLLGQEAAQVGSARAMRSEDFAFSSYREHGVAYCRGVTPAQLFPFWRGTGHSGWRPQDVGMAVPAVIVGAQGLHATGYALGMQRDGADAAVIAYFGDGASAQGDIAEAIVFAASFEAPVVFFCQNNQWAISEPVELQTKAPIHRRSVGYGIPGIQVDGNDVLAVLAVTRWALRRAREGSGPSLIEAVTYRMGPHTTSDDASRYRSPSEVGQWQARDPLARVAALLRTHGDAGLSLIAGVEDELEDVAAEVRRSCVELPDPAALSVFDNAYAEPHPLVRNERERHAAYLASFEGA